DAYVARLKNESAILSFNITTGEQHQLFKGSVAQAYLSPDDTMIAMVATFAQVFNQPLVFQLRPIQNSLVGDPVTSIPNGAAYAPVWAPDSSHLFLGIERDAASTAIPGQPNATPDTGVVFASTISVDRAGIVTALPHLPESISDFPIDVSPDGQRLFRAALSQSGQSPDARLWQSTTSGTQPHPLTKPSAYRFSKFAWSPGGETAVGFAQQPFLLQPTANNNALGDISVASLIAINQDGTSFPVISRMNEALGTNVIGWLPENAFPSTAPSELPSQLSEPTPVDLNQFNGAIDSGSQASPDGRYIVMTNHDTNQPVVWSHAVSLGRSLPPETHDLSWFPDSQVLIGVGNSSGTQQGGPSRISTFVPAFSVSLPTYDFRSYDPAAIGSSSEKQYALPLISPDENALAFFVTDTRDRSTSLWLVSYARQPELITSWSAPPDGRIALAPLGGWANANSFIFAEPAKWQNGLPDEVQLNRLTVERDGNARIDTVTKLQTHGTEHGVALEELAVSMQSGRVAYRLRHFARASLTDGVTDTVEIASGNKIADALEVTRRGAAIGLTWSPDGEILAAASPDELDLFSGSGTLLGSLVGLQNAANPRWINQNQIWFDERTNQGDRVMSVHLK
ncbi:MAG TPA: WD40 repeat domain-containing protein, partial [Nitrolancea sp.]|nr:WD40 repeat domain-containing protein [Nitrolancea sp.]